MRVVRAFVIALVVLGGAHHSSGQTSYRSFSTLAGTASIGSSDGTGADARFWNPTSVAVDSTTGNIYVADTIYNIIRKITPSGVVSTFAGQPSAFSCNAVDGVGSAARFCQPVGVAVNSNTGTVYVADGAHTIRAITPAGEVTTLAGTAGACGATNGTGSAARFCVPSGVAVNNATGTIYVTEWSNHTVRAITPLGVVTTLAGSAGVSGTANGTGSLARFDGPRGIAVNSASGTIYVADTNNSTIRTVTPLGVVATFAGTPFTTCAAIDGAGAAARFCFPRGVSVDSATSTVYVADTSANAIRRITPAGVVSTLAGTSLACGGVDATGGVARFCSPTGVAINGTTGVLYVADQQNHAIRTVTSAGVAATLAGMLGRGIADGPGNSARFNGPTSVAVNLATGTTYVADSGNHTIRTVSPAGLVTTLAGLPGTSGSADGFASAARFNNPRGIAVDSATGMVYIADTGNHTIRAMTPDGVVTTLAGSPGSMGTVDGTGSAARFRFPQGIAVNSAAGIIYVADSSNHVIRLVAFGGAVFTWAGLAGTSGSADGAASVARFNSPSGIAVDPATWTVYVADTSNQTVRRITASGDVSTLAGTVGLDGLVDGAGSIARFWAPRGIAVWAGLVFVSDNVTIRSIAPDGFVSRVGGLAPAFFADGFGTGARFFGPIGIATDAAGQLLVADSGNHAIRLGDRPVPVSGDFDGDSESDLAVFGPASGRWQLFLSGTSSEVTVGWGLAGDLPVQQDYDGDGKTDVAVYRPSNNGWYILQSATSTLLTVLWGSPGDIPVPQDYDGDGNADIAVYRPSTGEWFIIRSSNSTLLYVGWGIPGDVPIQGDFDGDAKADIGVYRPSSNTWFIIRSSNSTLLQVGWGIPGDTPVPSDYDGDGKTDIGVYRPSTGDWFIIRSTNSTLLQVGWGGAVGMVPVPADYDQDGRTDIAVHQPSGNTWYIITSSNSGSRIVTWP